MQKITTVLVFAIFMGISETRAQQIVNFLPEYLEHYKPEKLHLHFDKSVYNKGETIWYKSYILAGDSLSDFSRNFYVDWYDDNGQLIVHTVQPVFESSARGQFDIPANYRGEMIHLKAYTQWMLNFDSSFVYRKDIQIIQTDSTVKTKPFIPAATIQFFPEGGELINGVNSTVAFLAANQAEKPVEIRGAIFNNSNQLIDSFVSVHNGMGKFSLEASSKETYYAKWMDEYGIDHISPLPNIKPTGVALECQLKKHKAVFVIKRSPEITEQLKSVHIVATINQQFIFNAAANLATKRIVTGEIAIDSIQSGILQITLFDANWIPIAERVLFIKSPEYEFFPDVRIVSKKLSRRAKNTLEINVSDSVLSNLSIAITDAGLFRDSSTNIFSQFLLSSDLKGYIHQPAYYFSNDNETIDEQLDLVMLTHGWRKYKWDEIAKRQLPLITYPIDSDYLQIKGNVTLNSQMVNFKPNQSITLIMQAKDSSKQYFYVPVKPDGSFRQRGVIFFDSSKVFYQLNGDKRLNEYASVNFQYSLPQATFARSMKVSNFRRIDSIALQESRSFFASIANKKKSLDSTVILKEVIVNSKIKSSIEILDEKYTTGLFASRNGYSFDVLNDTRAHASIDIFHYLQDMIPGLSMSIPIMGANGAGDANSSNVPGLSWRDGTPDLFINELPADAGTLMDLSMSEVAYIKAFRPPFMAASGSGASGAIVVYTKKGSDIRTDNIKGLNHVLLTGYSNCREFYHPDYSVQQTKYADTRSTIYWNPYVLTDKKNKTVKIEFYNNDISNRYRIILEGVNANGKLARVEKIVE
ncbi:MAG: hypothetical protein K2Q21_07305 [Chitinophagaceae bacterium]|nr:hypothetical protein [Chitinophagaceae bacterium]